MKRGTERKYLPEFVYGATDGTVTTFAVVAGAFGASLSPAIIIILGLANLFGDGFSMAISNYLSTKSQKELSNRRSPSQKIPKRTAVATFFSFVLVGAIPLLSFVLAPLIPAIDAHKFLYSVILTAIAFLAVGAVKGEVVGKHRLKSALETLLIGGIAAFIAFSVGYLLRGITA